ncbi:hypothetical protein ASG12_12130 [Williamsia sp. Leaf354]|jgi:hypothetical protein|uniref:hypothetical protein n=1 Tax=Williamsia sp. Leaf354 TaxID=1736349 RepID=UPI0006FDEC55|nr:hypothetical protein [Williamsia sp. Leaf354]KQR97808.1 hypothetical protein ASG12_12130 [Williamsia sp. Leaf354]
MTTISVNTAPAHSGRTAAPTVSIAGVAWPRHKVAAVLTALVVAVVVGVLTGSGEVTAWAVTIAATAVWWTGRLGATRRATTR